MLSQKEGFPFFKVWVRLHCVCVCVCLAFSLCIYLSTHIQVVAASCYWEQRCRTQECRYVSEVLASSLDTYLWGASSTHGKGHEEGGLAYAKAGSSLRGLPGNSRASTPKTSLPTFCFMLSPTPLTLRGAVPHYLSLKKELAYSSS